MNIDDDDQQRWRVVPIICAFDTWQRMDFLSYKIHFFVVSWSTFNNFYAHIYPLAVHRSQKLAPIFPSSSWLIYTLNVQCRPRSLMVFSLVRHNSSGCPVLILLYKFSSNYFHCSPFHCDLSLWYVWIYLNSSPGQLALERGTGSALNIPLHHLIQPRARTRTTSAVPTTTAARSDSTIQTLRHIIDEHFMVVRRTCYMHENLPRTLQGGVA